MKELYTYFTNSTKAILILAFCCIFQANLHAQSANDVGIIAIHSPESQCGLGNETIEVTIQNFGLNPQALIPFNFTVNGVSGNVPQPLDGVYTGVLGTDSIVTIAFETTFDFSAEGVYTIAAFTQLESDTTNNNDTTFYSVENILTVGTLPYFNNFESNVNGWSVDLDDPNVSNSSWEFGTPTNPNISAAASGVNAWVTSLGGDHNNSELSYILSPCIDFSTVLEDPVISFSINYDTETNYDGGWLEGSTDGGISWTKVGTMGQGVNWYNFNNTNQGLGDVWAGNSGGWLNAEITLEDYSGEDAVRFRFAFDSDGSVTNDGVGIDDIFITIPLAADIGTSSANHEDVSLCGTDMDHVVIEIRNYGTEAQSSFDVSYQINNDPIVTENVGALVINAGETASYTFTEVFNSNVFNTVFEISTWTNLGGELNTLNDSTSYSFSTVIPEPLPIVKDFEDATLPVGWTADGIVGDGHNNVSFALYDNLYSGDQNFEVTSPILGPINPGDSLTFDYRYTEWSAGTDALTLGTGDELNVQISTDCGETFATIFTIDQNNHIPSAVMTNSLVDLDAYAGEYIQIRFFATWGTDDYWMDLDNINIIGCPVDFAENTIITGASNGAEDGSATVNPTQGQAPYDYTWSNGSTSNSVTNLAPGSYNLTIVDANECSFIVEVEITECPIDFGVSSIVTGVTMAGDSDGSITVTPSAGVEPYAYSWDTGMNTATISNLEEGDYTVTVVDANGCMDIITVTLGIGVSAQDLQILRDIIVAPNPTSGITFLNLSFNTPVELQVEVVNLVGQTVFVAKAPNTLQQSYEVDLTNYSSGMYFIRLSMNNETHIEKLIRM